jgi:hypothetical protein
MPKPGPQSDLEQLVHRTVACFGKWVRLGTSGGSTLVPAGGRGSTHSPDFAVASANVGRTLVLDPQNLTIGVAGQGQPAEQIPGNSVSFQPTSLGPGETKFRFSVAVAAVQSTPGGTYWGSVTACVDSANPGGNPVDAKVRVWLVVP